MTTQQLAGTDTLSPPEPQGLRCQTCDNDRHFSFLGEQVWSQMIAERLHIHPRVTLWNCEKCGTTFTLSVSTDT